MGRITCIDFLPTVNVREYDVEEQTSDTSVLFVASGQCGIHALALTFVPEKYYVEVDEHHVRTLPLATLLERIYADFDAADSSDGGSGSEDDESDEEDVEPRPKRQCRRPDKLWAWVAK